MTTASAVVVFPNPLPIVIAYLADYFGEAATIGASVPTGSALYPQLPFIQVVPSGGGWLIRKQLDEVVLNINVYGHRDSLSAVDDLARTARAVIESMQGHRTSGAVITRTTELSGASRLPEEDQLVTRVGFTVALLVRPLPA